MCTDQDQSREQRVAAGDLIDALTDPAAYTLVPELSQRQASDISFLQTHISLLFLVGNSAGGRVYKVKKPVDLGFLDFTTLDARKHFCEEEVRLNRRMAADVYLGVRPIVRGADDRLRIGAAGEGEVVDYAVEMKRLPAERMLSCLLDQGAIDNQTIDAICDVLTEFHDRCDTGPQVDQYAVPAAIKQQIQQTLDQLQPFAGTVISAKQLHAMRTWFDQWLDEHEALLRDRIADKRIREGHGDLHSGNICVFDGRVIAYDCIEFSPRFRCRDVACEIGFLAMDLDARGYRGFAGYLTQRYAGATDDADLHRLVWFYKVYLALVRAKVAALEAQDEGRSEEDRAEALARGSRYALLAGTYLIEPALMIMCGLPATGKSWAAHTVAKPFEGLVLRSDVIRKELVGLQPTQNASKQLPEAYSADTTQRTYAELLHRAQSAIKAGRTVVADATFASPEQRGKFTAMARECGVPWIVVHTHAPESVIRQRMRNRATDQTEVSDADWSVYKQARTRWQEPVEIDSDHLMRVGPNSSMTDVASAAIDALLMQRT